MKNVLVLLVIGSLVSGVAAYAAIAKTAGATKEQPARRVVGGAGPPPHPPPLLQTLGGGGGGVRAGTAKQARARNGVM